MTRDEALGWCVILAVFAWAIFDVLAGLGALIVLLVGYGVLVRWLNMRRLRRAQRSVADAARDQDDWLS